MLVMPDEHLYEQQGVEVDLGSKEILERVRRELEEAFLDALPNGEGDSLLDLTFYLRFQSKLASRHWFLKMCALFH